MDGGRAIDCAIDIRTMLTKFANSFVRRLARQNSHVQDVTRNVDRRL